MKNYLIILLVILTLPVVSQDKKWIAATYTSEVGNVWTNPERSCQHADPAISLNAGETKNIELKASISPQGEQVKLPMKERRDMYLIFKEAVNNMAKHSRAAHAFISFQLQDKTLILVIEDDGTGFDTAAPLINNGLKNMQERAQRNKWQLQVRSKIGSGTTITLHASIA